MFPTASGQHEGAAIRAALAQGRMPRFFSRGNIASAVHEVDPFLPAAVRSRALDPLDPWKFQRCFGSPFNPRSSASSSPQSTRTFSAIQLPDNFEPFRDLTIVPSPHGDEPSQPSEDVPPISFFSRQFRNHFFVPFTFPQGGPGSLVAIDPRNFPLPPPRRQTAKVEEIDDEDTDSDNRDAAERSPPPSQPAAPQVPAQELPLATLEMGVIPSSSPKMVGGTFTINWQGKKIKVTGKNFSPDAWDMLEKNQQLCHAILNRFRRQMQSLTEIPKTVSFSDKGITICKADEETTPVVWDKEKDKTLYQTLCLKQQTDLAAYIQSYSNSSTMPLSPSTKSARHLASTSKFDPPSSTSSSSSSASSATHPSSIAHGTGALNLSGMPGRKRRSKQKTTPPQQAPASPQHSTSSPTRSSHSPRGATSPRPIAAAPQPSSPRIYEITDEDEANDGENLQHHYQSPSRAASDSASTAS